MDKLSIACQLAYDYYDEMWDSRGLSEIVDLGEKWIFYPHGDEPFFGGSHITVSKANLEIELFMLPDQQNFALLRNGVRVEVPEEFR